MLKTTIRIIFKLLILFLFSIPAYAELEYEGPCSKLPTLPTELSNLTKNVQNLSDFYCNFANIGYFSSASPNWLEITSSNGKKTENIVFAYVNTNSQTEANLNKNCHWKNVRQNIENMGFLCNNQ